MKCFKGLNKQGFLILLFIALIAFSGCAGSGLQITTSSLPDGTVGNSYDAYVQANETVSGWAISAGTLPPGIILNTTNGHLTGIPTVAGDNTFTVEAIQMNGILTDETAYKQFTITINP